MSTDSAALSRLIEQVEVGLDVLVTGTPAETRSLLAEAAERLRPAFRVVEVAAEAAGLSLSRLMAQLSGRGDLDAQDDAVLELGFRRLAVPEAPGQQTVLLLNAGQGIQRSALRFLQHVGRGAPGLVMVVIAGAELEALLDEPAFAALRARLTAAPALACDQRAPAPEPVPLPLLAAPMPPSPPAEPAPLLAPLPAPPVPVPQVGPALPLLPRTPLSPVAARASVARGRGRIWAVSGAGMVASLALGAWIGHASVPRTTPAAGYAPGSGPAPAITAPAPAADEAAAGPVAPLRQAAAAAPAHPPLALPAASPGATFTTKIEPAETPAPVPATPAGLVLAACPAPVPAAAPAPAAPAERAPVAPAQQAAAAGPLPQPVPAEVSAEAFNPAPEQALETLQARAPSVSTLPPEAAEPAPAPKAALAAAPPVAAPEEPVQVSGPDPADDEAHQGGGTANTRTKPALARPAGPVFAAPAFAGPVFAGPVFAAPVFAAPVLDVPVPPSPPKADPSPRTAHSRRSEPPPKDSPPRMADRRTRSPHGSFREPEAARYDWEDQGPPPGYRAPPRWLAPRYAPPAEGPYIGTYAAGPYGMRTFRYER